MTRNLLACLLLFTTTSACGCGGSGSPFGSERSAPQRGMRDAQTGDGSDLDGSDLDGSDLEAADSGATSADATLETQTAEHPLACDEAAAVVFTCSREAAYCANVTDTCSLLTDGGIIVCVSLQLCRRD
jgi:hypothetical protein